MCFLFIKIESIFIFFFTLLLFENIIIIWKIQYLKCTYTISANTFECNNMVISCNFAKHMFAHREKRYDKVQDAKENIFIVENNKVNGMRYRYWNRLQSAKQLWNRSTPVLLVIIMVIRYPITGNREILKKITAYRF